jgi:hypothetical protein
MLTSWQRQAIDSTIEKLKAFYEDSSKGYFSGANKIEEYTTEERVYFDNHFSLKDLIKADEEIVLNKILDDPQKINFALYLLRSSSFSVHVNALNDGKSVFEQLVSSVFKSKERYSISNSLLHLYQRGYRAKETDGLFIKSSYQSINSQEGLVIWCIARFAYLLNDSDLLEKALNDENTLLTIVSFKLKKPVGINYPNLLGVANNAFLHYRANGDILLHAMKHYDVYDETLNRDQKKTFRYRLEDFQKYKPIQNTSFNEIVYKIFPELKSTRLTP